MTIEIEYELRCEPEYDSYRGNCSAVDEATDLETEQWIESQLASGNEWAWCSAHMIARVTVDGLTWEGHDYLGQCSYESEAGFIEANDYYQSMKDEARDDLLRRLTSAVEQLTSARKALAELGQ